MNFYKLISAIKLIFECKVEEKVVVVETDIFARMMELIYNEPVDKLFSSEIIQFLKK